MNSIFNVYIKLNLYNIHNQTYFWKKVGTVKNMFIILNNILNIMYYFNIT